jgi:hypothetical protein
MSGPQFQPIYQNQYAYEAGMPHGTTTNMMSGHGVAPPLSYHPAFASGSGASTAGGVIAVGARSGLEPDQVPLTHEGPEIDDFRHNFNAALGRIGEEDDPATQGGVNGHGMNNNGYNNNGEGADAPDRRPLWQQNRRQSRNLMWT